VRTDDGDLFKLRPVASAAYLTHYGPAPVISAGSYQALVGFLPRIDAPAKVSPFPVFQVASQDAILRLLQRLLSADPDLLRRYNLVNPFPVGTRILSLNQQNEVVRIDLSRHVLRQQNISLRRAIVLSLSHSLVQFPGISKVLVTVEGIPLAGADAYHAYLNPIDVVAPSTPRIVGAAAVSTSSGEEPDSISLYFDRPVSIKDLQLIDDHGMVITGNIALENFDMTVLLRPSSPKQIHAGMRVRVTWEVLDALGESGRGEQLFHLVH
jgi:hypothetical protein